MNQDQTNFAVLIVDDDPLWFRSFGARLEIEGVTKLLDCRDLGQVQGMLERHDVGVVLLDLSMPPHRGEEVLPLIVAEHPDVLVIVVTATNEATRAGRCLRAGAYDYVWKDDELLLSAVMRAVRRKELERRLVAASFKGIVTNDPNMRRVFLRVERLAKEPGPLLITGETGVGKDRLAVAAHELSGLRGLFVPVNLGSLSENMIDAELFGHQRGAFTDAQARAGLIASAAEGTLFLDEVGDLPLSAQARLLRFLDRRGEYRPLGSDQAKQARVRVIAATHHDLATDVREGKFRQDLYHRLRVHHVAVPPLRERSGDIVLLLHHFLQEEALSRRIQVPILAQGLEELLSTYPFPGNVRELEGMVENAVALHEQGDLSAETFREAMGLTVARPPRPWPQTPNPFSQLERLPLRKEAQNELDDHLFSEALRRFGTQTKAAAQIQVHQSTLSKWAKERCLAETTTTNEE